MSHRARTMEPFQQDFSIFLKISPLKETETEMTKAVTVQSISYKVIL
jgi:hypothetical protein